jgi:hypothetical protein
LGLLIGGFGIGQGSIFLAQTWLVATGRTDLLAQFGTHFSFAMLGIIAVEAGSLTILSAQIARLLVAQGSERDLWRCYWETTIFRLTMAAALAALIVLAEAFVDLPDFTSWYLIGALPALLVWAFNGAGFLDGLQKSGISGITGSIAYVASAAALLVAIDADPATAGLITGAALGLGYTATVLVQFVALWFAGYRPRLERVTAAGVRTAFVEEGSMLIGLLPGQLYFRAQLALATAFLGTTPTAMLVYAKQIVGAASQISGFARRIEFPRMVQALAAHPQTSNRTLVTMQKGSFAIAGVMACGIVAASLVVVARFDGFTREAWMFLAIFSVTILTEAVGQSLVQAMFARHLFHSAAAARIIAVCVAIGVCSMVIGMAGIMAFVVADLVSHALVISLSLWWLARNMARHGLQDI